MPGRGSGSRDTGETDPGFEAHNGRNARPCCVEHKDKEGQGQYGHCQGQH